MPSRRKWHALHVVDDDYYELLEIAEQSNGTFVHSVSGNVATARDLQTAMNAVTSTFKQLFPSHSCSPLCAQWTQKTEET